MKKIFYFAIALLLGSTAWGQAQTSTQHIIHFNPDHEVSGQKFALRDINPDLPRDWDGYEFVILEFRITTPQRFNVGFTTDSGYNELRVMSYVPNAWNRLAIPLRFFRRLPDARIDLAATFNQPRYTGWVNLGGRRGELHGVDSIGIRMRMPIGTPEFELRNVTLAVEDPGDQYLSDIPAVDEFGQHNLVSYEGKALSLTRLEADWRAEEADIENFTDYNYSRFGGYKQRQIESTGFFRTEKVDGRWWFVDPEGYLFLSHGVDCVTPGRGGNANHLALREGMFKELPPQQFRSIDRRGSESASFGQWNLHRRFGDDYRAAANEMAIKRMDKWGLNTIANWSSTEVYDLKRKAHTLGLRSLGVDGSLMGLADVYAPDFEAKMDESMASYLPENKDNPWVLGYFVGNEPSWIGQEARLCDLILDGPDRPIKAELQKFLNEKGDTPSTRKAFIYKTFDTFLQTVRTTMKRHDPNHLNLGIRFGNLNELDEELMAICARAFDVFSFNCYALEPDHDMMSRAMRLTDRPMIIGEYHFGTVDGGMAQSLWQVENQQQRGVAYRYYTERGYAHPGLIGTAYFQWCDQDLTGRASDGENYNCGLVDVTDRPYQPQVEAMMATAQRLYDVHSGTAQPYDQKPVRARGHEGIPDIWNAPISKKIEIVKRDEKFHLMIDGVDTYIKGVGGTNRLDVAAANGANAFRTWGGSVESARRDMARAQQLGMYVMQGIGLPKDSMQYHNEAFRERTRASVRVLAEALKDDPNLLVWGIGNEIEHGTANTPTAWAFVNELALLIKSIDSHHLVSTVIAHNPSALDLIARWAPDLDVVGINSYGSIDNVAQMVDDSDYRGAYIITEWGPTGWWETTKTPWGAPIEQTSEEKRQVYENRYNSYIKNSPKCLGSFVFLWGQKEERTPTWFSMFVENDVKGLPLKGEKTPMVEAMERVWKGTEPQNVAPVVHSMSIDKVGKNFVATVEATDRENVFLTYVWEVLKEATVTATGGAYEPRPERVGKVKTTKTGILKTSISKPGNYRLYVYVLDGEGFVSTANVPFEVTETLAAN